MWTCRRLLKKPRTDFISNTKILRRYNAGMLSIVEDIKKSKCKHIGSRKLREENLLLLQEKMIEKKQKALSVWKSEMRRYSDTYVSADKMLQACNTYSCTVAIK